MSEVASQKAPHGKVGWFELFYDLVIVAAVGYAAHTFAEHPSWGLGVWIAAWTLIMFVLWSLTSLHHNPFPGDSAARRGLVLLQMLALVVAALGSVADEGLPRFRGIHRLRRGLRVRRRDVRPSARCAGPPRRGPPDPRGRIGDRRSRAADRDAPSR